MKSPDPHILGGRSHKVIGLWSAHCHTCPGEKDDPEEKFDVQHRFDGSPLRLLKRSTYDNETGMPKAR